MANFYPIISADDGAADDQNNVLNNGGVTAPIGRRKASSGAWTDHGYFRIRNITIPQGSTILSATFHFYVTNISSYGGLDTCGIYLENDINPGYITSFNDWSNRPLLSISANSGISSTGWKSYNVAGAVQSLVNNAGWVSGNSMQIHTRHTSSQSRGWINVQMVNAGSLIPYLSITWTPPAPSAPSNFGGVAQGTSSILWSWTDVDTETGYRVLDNSLNPVSGDLAAGTTSWLETNLSPGTNYARRVQAYNSGGSANSSEATVSTQAPLAATAQVMIFS